MKFTRSVLILAVAASGVHAIGAAPGPQVVIQGGGASMDVMGMAEMVAGRGASTPLEAGTGVIVGRVVEADGGSAVPGTIVTLSVPGFMPLRVLTDGQGRFAFRALPKGRFSLSATRPGFVDGAHGRSRPGAAPEQLELTDKVRSANVDIMVWRHAAIAGTVLDENNEPLVGAPVRAFRRDYAGGRRRLIDGGVDTTDDRGQFRIGSLEPGEYVIALPITQQPSLDSMMRGMREAERAVAGGAARTFAVRVEGRVVGGGSEGSFMTMTSSDSGVPVAGTDAAGNPLTYQTEFFSGSLSASQGTAIPLAAGEERTGVDFRLTPVRALSISGVITGPGGAVSNTQLQLIPADAQDLVSPVEAATANSDANGQFEFSGVPAGQYILRAQRTPRFAGGPGETYSFTAVGGDQMEFVTRAVSEIRMARGPAAQLPTEPTLWAEVSVAVGTQALAGLTVSLREGLRVSGQVAFQGSATQPTPEARAGININLEPADGRTAGVNSIAFGRVDPNGTFTTMGVPAGKYILRVNGAPQGWSLRGASFGGRDITETAIELKNDSATGVILAFADRPSDLSGTVRDSSGNADASATVIVFPVDPAGWVDTGSQPRRLKTSRAGNDGSFKIGPLPPGEYHVVAVDGSVPRTWQDPAYLDILARSATSVRVGEGDSRTVTLTSTKGPA